MTINILGASGRIGGSSLVFSSRGTNLLFDAGKELDPTIKQDAIEGIHKGERKIDAFFLSHAHEDHSGRINELLPSIPIYMDEGSYRQLCFSSDYLDKPKPRKPTYFHDGVPIIIKGISITPIRCDHSAYFSYMFLMEIEGKKILYTGDFRGKGRYDYDRFLSRLGKVDVLISEGSTLDRKKPSLSEGRLMEILKEECGKYRNVFMLSSGSNLTRIASFYKATRDKEFFLLDPYSLHLLDLAGGKMPSSSFKGIYAYNPYLENKGYSLKARNLIKEEGFRRISADRLMGKGYAVLLKGSSYKYLFSSLPRHAGLRIEDSLLVYSMWEGYLEEKDKDISKLVKEFDDLGGRIIRLHASGHADEEDIDKLVNRCDPSIIIPVHGNNPGWFKQHYKGKRIHLSEEPLEI